jgi:hypothetical protein
MPRPNRCQRKNVRIYAGKYVRERMSEYMPERTPNRMSEYIYICRTYFQMICRKLCGSNLSGWGSLEVQPVFSKEAWVDLCPWTKASEAPFWRGRVRWLTSWFGACSFFHIPTERNDDDDHDDEWMNEWMDAWMNEWMDAWMNEWMDEWMNEWKNERMD